MEYWKQVPLGSRYEASTLGRIRIKEGGKILKQFMALKAYPGGYLCVRIELDGGRYVIRTVHRIIAQTFHDNPNHKPTVNHINGVKHDNSVINLEWSTHSENIQHAYDNGLRLYRPLHYKGKFGSDHNRSKAVKCVETGAVFGSMSEAGRVLMIDTSSVSWSIKHNKHIYGMHFKINQ